MPPRPPKKVRDAQKAYEDALAHQVAIERLKASLIGSYDARVAQAEKQIVEALQSLELLSVDELTQAKLEALIRDLRQVQTELYAEETEQLTDQLSQFGTYEAQREAEKLRGWADARAKAIPINNPPAKSVMDRVYKKPITATGELLKPFLQTVPARAKARLEGAIREGHARGETMAEMIRRIRGTKKQNYTDGITALDRRQAQGIVRTAVQHVSNQALMATWEENPDLVDGYIYIATLDNRTTLSCAALDGQRFELGKGPVPPIHPNCRSRTIADLGPEFDFLKAGATRSSDSGYVDAKTTYYDWLKKQTPEYIKETLGAKRAEMFMAPDMTAEKFAQSTVSKTFEPLTLAQMRANEGIVPPEPEDPEPEPQPPQPTATDKAEIASGFDFPVTYRSQTDENNELRQEWRDRFVEQVGATDEDVEGDFQDRTLNEGEIWRAINEENGTPTIVEDENGNIVAAISVSYRRSKTGGMPDFYVENVGSIAPKGGTFAMRQVLKDAADGDSGVRLISLEEAEEFYRKWDFQDDDDGTMFLTPEQVKKTLVRMDAYLSPPQPVAGEELLSIGTLGKRKPVGHLASAKPSEGISATYRYAPTPEEGNKEFQKRFNMDGEAFASHILRGTENIGLTDVTVDVAQYKFKPDLREGSVLGTAVFLRIRGKSKEGKSFSIERLFREEASPDVEHAYFDLPKDLQGSGFGKIVSQNFLDFYDHLGTGKIDIAAGLDVGAYAWARYGFVPSPTSWSKLRDSIKTDVERGKIKLAGETLQTVTDALASDDPRSIRVLAAIREPYGDTTVGKKLLLGREWSGSLDLNNEDDYAVYRQYITPR